MNATSVGIQELSGSYSGSFAGDGSQLTNLPFSSQLINGPAKLRALGNNVVRELDVIDDDFYFIIIDRPEGTNNIKIEWTGTGPLTILQARLLQQEENSMTYYYEILTG